MRCVCDIQKKITIIIVVVVVKRFFLSSPPFIFFKYFSPLDSEVTRWTYKEQQQEGEVMEVNEEEEEAGHLTLCCLFLSEY